MPLPNPPWPALLLLGPTGAGKSPLGDRLEREGLRGRPCAHFDFGRELRRAAADPAFAERRGLGAAERRTVERVLVEGALLEAEDFGIAEKLLDGFAAVRLGGGALLILNGLPRHVGQAERLRPRLEIRTVVALEADESTVLARIRANTGGDRGGRADDATDAIRRRVAAYRARTAPLAEYYAARGAALLRLPVGKRTSAVEILRRIEAAEDGEAAASP